MTKQNFKVFYASCQIIDYFKQKITSDKANAIHLQNSSYGLLRLLYGLFL